MIVTRKHLLGLATLTGLALGLGVPAAATAAPAAPGASFVTVDSGAEATDSDVAALGRGEGAADSDVAAFAASGIKYGGPIKRAKVIERAKYWYDINVPYSQKAYHYDKNKGKKYRTDCSGFVSMSWALTSSRTTETLPAVSTKISWSALKPGDMVLRKGHHVQLFEKWADSKHTTFWIYEEGSTASDMNHYKVKVSSAKSHSYVPYKYKKIQ